MFVVKIRKEKQGNDSKTKHLGNKMERKQWPRDLGR